MIKKHNKSGNEEMPDPADYEEDETPFDDVVRGILKAPPSDKIIAAKSKKKK